MSSVDLDRLRDAAIEALRQGWRVTPGTYLNARQQWMGDEGRALGLGALDPTGRRLRDPEDCQRQWAKHPYSVLAACGVTFDVALLHDKITAMRATHGLQGAAVRTPILVVPGRGWGVFVSPAAPDARVLAAQHDGRLTLLATGDWIPLPPTRLPVPDGAPRECVWAVSPTRTCGEVGTAASVCAQLANAL